LSRRPPSPKCLPPTDPIKIINKRLERRADDHGGSAATATLLAGAPAPSNSTHTLAVVAGNIERTADEDWFAFNASAGAVTLTLDLCPVSSAGTGAFDRSNLDLRVRVYNQSRALLASFDPPEHALLSGVLQYELPVSGTYYLAVAGTGDRNGGLTAWSPYASLGEYRFNVEHPTAEAPLTGESSGPALVNPQAQLSVKVRRGAKRISSSRPSS